MRRARAFSWLLSWAALSQPISHQVYPHFALWFTPLCWSLAFGVAKDSMFPVTMEELWVLETRNENYWTSLWVTSEFSLGLWGVKFAWGPSQKRAGAWCCCWYVEKSLREGFVVTQHWWQLEGADRTRLARVKKLCWKSETCRGHEAATLLSLLYHALGLHKVNRKVTLAKWIFSSI